MMKKFFFFIITVSIIAIIFELMSFTVLKVYKKIYVPKIEKKYKKVNLENGSRRDYHQYHAFYGWKKKDITSESINVKNYLRKTESNSQWDSNSKIWFFGGSTMWGSGVPDEHTIPSYAAKLDHTFQPVNLGEDGYNAGQSLNRLIEIIDQINEGDHVIFFDGVNDSFSKCDTNNGSNGTEQVRHIRKLIEKDRHFFKGYLNSAAIKFTESNSFIFYNGVKKKLGFKDNKLKTYGCINSEYAFEVANSMVRHWKIGEIITKNKKANFHCILQPNPYTADFKVPHATKKVYRNATNDVYPIVKNLAKSLGCFSDFTKIFTEDFYIDECCHVSDLGNNILAREIINNIFRKK